MISNAFQDERLLSWVSDLTQLLCSVTDGADGCMDVIRAVMKDEALREFVVKATAGRCAPHLVSEPGLEAIRFLAAVVFSNMDSEEDERAAAAWSLGKVLQALEDRIGSRTESWINSLQLIGQRIVAALYQDSGCESFYGSDGIVTFNCEVARTIVMAHPGCAAIDIDVLVDLVGDTFEELLAKYGEFALGVALAELDRWQLDGAPDTVRPNHFEKAVADAVCQDENDEQRCDSLKLRGSNLERSDGVTATSVVV